MKPKIVTVLSVAVAMALPVGGALAQTGTFTADTAAAAVDAAASVDTSGDGAADLSLGANVSVDAQAAIDTAPARAQVPPADRPTTDVAPTDVEPTDVKPTDVRPTDTRPTDVRPTDTRPTDVRPTDRPEREPRHEIFRVHDAGAVALWWTPRQFVNVEVRAADGWRHKAWRESPRIVKVALTNGEKGYLFTAAISEDGTLRTHIEERAPETTTERFEVGEAGKVAVTYSVHGIHDVEVAANDGWRHKIDRVDRRTVRVGFTNGEVAYLFTAHVTEDGALRTHIERRKADRPTDERPTTDRPTDERPTTDRPTDATGDTSTDAPADAAAATRDAA